MVSLLSEIKQFTLFSIRNDYVFRQPTITLRFLANPLFLGPPPFFFLVLPFSKYRTQRWKKAAEVKRG